jgi:transposase InsO family protein
MGRPAGWMKALTGRSPMKSPGKPTHRRHVERLFWRQIAAGLSSEDAAVAVGVSPAVGSRWFRERGGMPLFMIAPLAGRVSVVPGTGRDRRELLAGARFATRAQARTAVAGFLDEYNNERRHSTAGRLPPVVYEARVRAEQAA